jgi:colanic acid/amylovoran biosynthesis glycosyltransferase
LGEIVENGVSGLQVTPKDSVKIAEAVTTLLRDPLRTTQLAKAGRARIEERFSADSMVEGTIGIYQDLLRSRA